MQRGVQRFAEFDPAARQQNKNPQAGDLARRTSKIRSSRKIAALRRRAGDGQDGPGDVHHGPVGHDVVDIGLGAAVDQLPPAGTTSSLTQPVACSARSGPGLIADGPRA